MPEVTLPPNINKLYKSWRTSPSKTFHIFRRYAGELSDICVRDSEINDKIQYFISKSSINGCRERIKSTASTRLKSMIYHSLRNDKDSLDQIEDILERKMSYSLVDMSRLNPKNRRKNEDFSIMLKRKLRLKLWPHAEQCICFCGKAMDAYGDHVLSCRSHCKTPLHNKIRDGLFSLLKELCKTVKLISGDTMVCKEKPRVIDKIPTIRPFDLAILFDHMLDETAWRSTLKILGFDVVVVPSKPTRVTPTRAARKNELKLRLSDGEKGKFCRRGKTCKETQITLTGDEIIGEIISDGMVLVPISVSPHGHVGAKTRTPLPNSTINASTQQRQIVLHVVPTSPEQF